jgi:hypothetical protein
MPLVTVTPPKSGCSTEIDVRAIVNALLYKNGACFRRMFR